MAFDPDEFLKEDVFDPDAFLAEDTFDPDTFAAEEPYVAPVEAQFETAVPTSTQVDIGEPQVKEEPQKIETVAEIQAKGKLPPVGGEGRIVEEGTIPTRPPIPQTPLAATAVGVTQAIPFVGPEGQDVEQLKREQAGSVLVGRGLAEAVAALGGGAGVAKVLGKTVLKKLPAMAFNAITRAIAAGGIRGAQSVEEVVKQKKSIKDALFDTIVESAGGAAFSVLPEFVLPKNAIQLIAQPLADAIYNAGVSTVIGEDVLTQEWFEQQIPQLAASLGFAAGDIGRIKPVKPGADIEVPPTDILPKPPETKPEPLEIVKPEPQKQPLEPEKVEQVEVKEIDSGLGDGTSYFYQKRGGKWYDVGSNWGDIDPKERIPDSGPIKNQRILKNLEPETKPEEKPDTTPKEVKLEEKPELTPEEQVEVKEIGKQPWELTKNEIDSQIEEVGRSAIEDNFVYHSSDNPNLEQIGIKKGRDGKVWVKRDGLLSRGNLYGYAIDLTKVPSSRIKKQRNNLDAYLQDIPPEAVIPLGEIEGGTLNNAQMHKMFVKHAIENNIDVPQKVKDDFSEIELTPQEQKFVEKVRPEVTIQKPKKPEQKIQKPEKIEKPKIEKPKKPKPIVEEKKLDKPEEFKTPQREGLLESERGYVQLGTKETKEPFGLAKYLKREFTTKGDLPKEVFKEKLVKDHWVNAELKEIENTVNRFRGEARRAYKTTKLSDKQNFKIDAVLKGEENINTLPENLRPVVQEMRNHIDALSQKMIDSGLVEGDLEAKVRENMGYYATRSYRVHDDPKWSEKVPEDLKNNAKALIRQEYPNLSENEVHGMIDELLYKKEAPVSILSSGSKLGAKNLGILKKRKDIPSQIRALWGEYKNADVNYAKSISKMANLIANHRFLDEVKKKGAGKFFHEDPIKIGDKSYSVKISADQSPTMKPLNGLYTTKEIADAFENINKRDVPGDLYRLYLKANSAVKYSKTIGSPMTHLRNVTGNVGFAIANGHFNLADAPKAINLTLKDLGGKSTGEVKKKLRELTELGVISDSARAGEIKDIIKDATQGDLDVLVGTGPKHAYKKGLKAIEKLYGAEDDIWKIFAYENEYKRYKKALPDMPEEELKKHVAEIVRNTYPTYSMIPEGVKKIRRWPLIGPFVSFPAEVIRTTKNTIGQASKELKDPKLRHIGAQRVAGMVMAATITSALGVASRYRNKITREKEEAAREFMPPWTKNSQIIWTSEVENGKANYVDLGYSDPHSYMKAPVMAFLRGEDWKSKMFETATELFSPFLSEDILAQKLINVKRNKTPDGQQVYNPQDKIENQTKDVFNHIIEAIEPGAITSLRRIYKSTQDIEGQFGSGYDTKTEVTAFGTGIRVNLLDTKRSLRFKGYRFQRDLREASRLAAKKGVELSFEQKKKIYDRFAKTIQSAKVMGLTDREIYSALKEAGLSGEKINAFRLNKYEALLESQKAKKGKK